MSLILVTGGAGFIGSHVTRRLLELGHQVRVVDNFSSGRRENLTDVEGRIDLKEADIRDPAVCRQAADGAEVILHIGAMPSVPRSVDQPVESNDCNINGTLNVLVAAREARVRRVVYSASSAAYGDTPTLPKVETMSPSPLSPYAAQKLAGEHYCRVFSHVYGLETVSLRYFNVFGPRQDPKSQYAAVIPAFVTRMLRGERPIVFGNGEQSRDFCYIDNVLRANLLAAGLLDGPAKAGKLSGEVMNIACGERITLNAIITMLNRMLDARIEPDYQPPRAGDVMHSLADIAAAKRIIGYEPQVMFEEGLGRTVEWFRRHGG